MKKSELKELLSSSKCRLPVLPLRDIVIFPQTVVPLFVGRKGSIRALEQSNQSSKLIVLLTQKLPDDYELPSKAELFETGTVGRVIQQVNVSNGSVKILVESLERIRVNAILQGEQGGLVASVELTEVEPFTEGSVGSLEPVLQFIKTHSVPFLPEDNVALLDRVSKMSPDTHVGADLDLIGSNLPLSLKEKQTILEQSDCLQRAELLAELIVKAEDKEKLERSINAKVRTQIESNQKDYFLQEKMRAIRQEMDGEDAEDELDAFKRKIEATPFPKEALVKVRSEFKKLKTAPSHSPEASVIRNYIETLLSVPWRNKRRLGRNLVKAQNILDADHYGLNEIKERIVEHLSIQKRTKRISGPILCLVGPPGVGKTSLAASIARATGRKYIRMALGGVHDEAEIRGHRRTYIGSMPGRIIQNIIKSGVKNPLILLDEVDKLSRDFRGDPASALLEVLDPEQNHSFTDHYLETEFDLSEVMFIATANTLNIPEPLLDRMEIIQLSGYTEQEKFHIGSTHLLPKQLKRHGVKANEVTVSDGALKTIINDYTREAGVRGLDQSLAKLCRKTLKSILLSEASAPLAITDKALQNWLGAPKYHRTELSKEDRVGRITGLAWTQVGGEILSIESVAFSGKGNLKCTGKLGEVMEESAQAAWSAIKYEQAVLGIDGSIFSTVDLHIHIPEGSTPKEGPSAGVAMALSMASSLTGMPLRGDLALTGEITLHGEVLAIGGVKEKLLAARRNGIKTILIPDANRPQIEALAEDVKQGLEIIFILWLRDAAESAFVGKIQAAPVSLLMDDQSSYTQSNLH